MAQQGPNPIDIYELTRGQFRPILSAVASSQLSSSTPCTEWTVQKLINHALAVQQFAQDVLGDGTVNPGIMSDIDHPLPAAGAAAALDSITAQVLETIKSLDLEAVVETPFGAMPGGQFIMVPITDMIIHTWDLAKATGQNTTLNATLAEVGYNVIVPIAPGGRENGAFAAEVSIPETASFQDRMLGASGRQP